MGVASLKKHIAIPINICYSIILFNVKGEKMPTINIYLSETEYVTAANLAAEKGIKLTELVQDAVKKMLKAA
jgi:hypothetical protein